MSCKAVKTEKQRCRQKKFLCRRYVDKIYDPTIPPDIEHAYMEYTHLLREYQDAKQAYQLDDTKENWDRMQETMTC